MREIKLKRTDYNNLCASGRIQSSEFNLFSVNWLTYYKLVAVCQDVRTEELEIVKLVVE